MSMPPELQSLAEAAGLQRVWIDYTGATREASPQTVRQLLDAMALPCATAAQAADSLAMLRTEQNAYADPATRPLWILRTDEPLRLPWQGSRAYRIELESGMAADGLAEARAPGHIQLPPIGTPGYHTLFLGDTRVNLAVCPPQCPRIPQQPEWAAGREGRAWGVAAQMYSLRHGASNELPDFSLLVQFASLAARAGASAVLLSPLHAMFSAAPHRYSPYSPSSRLFLNALYADPSTIAGENAAMQTLWNHHLYESSDETRRLANARMYDAADGGTNSPTGPLLDWPAQAGRRLVALRQVFDAFTANPGAAQRADLDCFIRRGGDTLAQHALYEALHAAHSTTLGPEHGWRDWPAALHDPRGAAARIYADRHREAIDFHVFLQWLADRGLAHAQWAARTAGMPIGLITDLAIGADPRGSQAWSHQADILPGVSVGAPPDPIQPLGQRWGLTALSPRALTRRGYGAYIDTLRAAMAHAGGVRIDHVMGLVRMWLVCADGDAWDGAYLQYPQQDLLRLLALEAWRHRTLVIGENLGTVPTGFNETLHDAGILGTSVLWFEREGMRFKAPDDWPDWSMATTTTHDLPTIEGWWAARDITWRKALGQLNQDQAEGELAMRDKAKAALCATLERFGATIGGQQSGLSGNYVQAQGAQPTSTGMGEMNSAPRQQVLAFVAATPAPLAIFPAEDLLGVIEQPNLPRAAHSANSPATGEPHPDWRRTLPVPVHAFFSDPRVQQSVASIAKGGEGWRAPQSRAQEQDSTGRDGWRKP
ncbi:4-alpha-glucanotransferase [Pusillimonas sp. TS35]|nr:4-alpha-glucanotransferase [Pusillimonas sp. TS35]